MEAKEYLASSLAEDTGYVVFNPHSFSGDGMVKIDGKSAYVTGIPSKGYACRKNFKTDNAVSFENGVAENTFFRITFDDDMQIVSVIDKECSRELLVSGTTGNQLRIYADYPDTYDAWEWQEYSGEEYITVTGFEKCEVIDDGARKGIRIVRKYNKSEINQIIWLSDEEKKIDFDTVVEWHEKHVMLKSAFELDIHSDKATYEIQYGTIERPTHRNTSWDKAKFEVCAQKYADLSDGGYGVSIINDCKYGHDIHGGVMQISLLRSPTDPNPDADQGHNAFVYSLCPHSGTLAESDTAKYAYYLNYPMTAVKASGDVSVIPEIYSAVSIDRDNVICETVKEAEDGTGTVIRLYEYRNICGETEFTASVKAEKCYLCDMMENELKELPFDGQKVKLNLKGFEIVTLKLV